MHLASLSQGRGTGSLRGPALGRCSPGLFNGMAMSRCCQAPPHCDGGIPGAWPGTLASLCVFNSKRGGAGTGTVPVASSQPDSELIPLRLPCVDFKLHIWECHSAHDA